MTIYRGVPFAEPPVNQLRWRPPAPKTPWDGVRVCDQFGPACPQPQRFFSERIINETPQKISEDCLYLNIWTSNDDNTNKSPVIMWIHGGGFVNGWGHQRDFDGAALANNGVVVVTINYRLGVFGFLTHPQLTEESARLTSGNYGLLDQIAALQWIQQNIDAFGGDQDRVTICGESAGGYSVNLLRLSPLAKGLFSRAICQSAPGGNSPGPALSDIQVLGEQFTEALPGKIAGDDVLNALRSVPAKTLLEVAQPDISLEDLVSNDGKSRNYDFGPVMDGWVLQQNQPTHDVPLLIGMNRDEGSYWAALPELNKYTRNVESYARFVHWRHPDIAERLLSLYPADNDDEVREAFVNLFTDTTFAQSTREVAQASVANSSDTFLYCFSRQRPGDQISGAYHSMEIAYVFNNTGSNLAHGSCTDDDITLANLMSSIWVQFATTGNPNGRNLPHWPVYEADTDHYLNFDVTVENKSGLRRAACNALSLSKK